MSARQLWGADVAEFELHVACPTDRDRVGRFLDAMDRDGLYQRHFSHGEAPNLALLSRIDALDQQDRVAIIAVARDGEVLGHGEYVAQHSEAEFALMVRPLFRDLGIGRGLLQTLLDIAARAGQREMHGMIQATNTRAVALVLSNGFRVAPGDDRSVVLVSRELTPSRDSVHAAPSTSAPRYPLPSVCNDTDRTPLHRHPGPGAPLRSGGG